MLAVTIFACLLSWWTVHRCRRHEEEAVLQQLTRIDGVHFVDAYCGPVFLRKIVARTLLNDFRVVTECSCESLLNDAAAKELFAEVSRFKNLKSIRVWDGADLAESDLQAIGRCTELESLVLGESQIGDAQLQGLASLHRLNELDLSGNPISAQGIRVLAALPLLEDLNVGHTSVDGEAIAVLRRFNRLARLNLYGAKLGDKDVEELGKLTAVEDLELGGTNITKEGFERLHRLLPNCRVGDGP